MLKENEQQVLDLYSQGYGTSYIGKVMGVSRCSVNKFLKRRGILLRGKLEASLASCPLRKKYIFDHSFFLQDSWQLAYFCGFCLADGSLETRGSGASARITISINKQDRELLEKFCEWLSCPLSCIKEEQNNKISLRFSDPILANCLEKYGIVKNKTYAANNYLDIPEEFTKPFLIGFIDGDGTLKFDTKKGYRFGIVGNKLTINIIVRMIKSIGVEGEFKFEDPQDKIWKRACLYRKNDICKLVEVLNPEKYFYLERKWRPFLDFLSAASI